MRAFLPRGGAPFAMPRARQRMPFLGEGGDGQTGHGAGQGEQLLLVESSQAVCSIYQLFQYGEIVTFQLLFCFNCITVTVIHVHRLSILLLAPLAMPGQVVPIAVRGPVAVVSVRLNGQGPFRMIIDTGASSCSIAPRVAGLLQLSARISRPRCDSGRETSDPRQQVGRGGSRNASCQKCGVSLAGVARAYRGRCRGGWRAWAKSPVKV